MIRAVLRTWSGRIGAALVSIMIVAALVSLVWTPHDPTRVNPRQKWLPMSSDHWLGTDGSGKDIFSVVLAGARSTLFVVLASVLLAALIGLAIGIVTVLVPRWVAESITYVVDILIALPGLIFALLLISVVSASRWTVAFAIGFGMGIVLARIVRGEAERVLASDYVLAARMSGASMPRTVIRHVLPNIAPTVVVQLSLVAAIAVLLEAALSYLGLTPVTTPSWGRMIESLQGTVTVHPWAIVGPGAAVVLTTLGFNLLGDGLREAIDPTLRRRGARGSAA